MKGVPVARLAANGSAEVKANDSMVEASEGLE